MSRRQVIECDRCGTIDSDGTPNRSEWGRIYAATLAGTDMVGTSETAADLCGGCLNDLRLFMSGGDPAPAPTKEES